MRKRAAVAVEAGKPAEIVAVYLMNADESISLMAGF